MIRILRDHFPVKFQGICDLHRVRPMGPEEQLRVIKAVEIVHRRPGTELQALDLLEVDIIDPLLPIGLAAETDPVKGFL